MRNLITDVAGLRVGNADDAALASGSTAILFDEPAAAAVDVRGGAPGTRETDLLDPHRTVQAIDAVVLSGGSAFGLDAGVRRAGVAARAGPRLRDRAISACRSCAARRCSTCSMAATRTGTASRPIRDWAMRRRAPPASTSRSAPPARATARPRSTSRAGWARPPRSRASGHTVGALVAVNACGSVTVGDEPTVLGGAVRAGRRVRRPRPAAARAAGGAGAARQGAARREHHHRAGRDRRGARQGAGQQMAVMAQDGLARAIYPVHTTLDGDTVFAAATGRRR